jgi:hypothetical protein
MRPSTKLFAVLALALAVGLATAVSPFASADPDGLERVATDHGFVQKEAPASIQGDSPLPGYAFPGIGDERLATGVGGFAGTLGVFAVALGVAWLLRRRTASPTSSAVGGRAL